MKFTYKLSIFLFILCVASVADSWASGFVQVRNFTRDSYSGGPQNWAVANDSIGRLYVGNRDGMLVYDGERWHKYPLPNFTTVRSLFYDHSTGRIYCGGTEEFGYFSPEPSTGRLIYKSLADTNVNRGSASFTEVWKVSRQGGAIWFQCDNVMLRFDGDVTRAITIPGRISCSEYIDGQIYVGTEDGKILELNDSGAAVECEDAALAGKKIRAILPLDDHLLVATEINGLYLLNGGKAEPYAADVNGFLKDNQLFCAAQSGDNYLFGTVTGGAVVKNFHAGTTKYINKESGMQNNTVLNAAFDSGGNVWLCLDNGLDYAMYNSPITNIIGPANNVGAGYSSLLAGKTMYFGTNQGLFSARYPFETSPSPLLLRRELQGQIWSITPIGDDSFFVSSDVGAFVHDGGGFHKIDGLGGTYCIRLLRGSSTRAIASAYDGFHTLQLSGGRWVAAKFPEDYPSVRGRFDVDSNNNLWISHWLKGVYRLSLAADNSRVESATLFAEDAGLPSARNNSVAIYKGRPIVVNEAGLYTLAPGGDRFVANKEISAVFRGQNPQTLHISGDRMVLIDKSGIEMARPGSNDSASHRIAMAKTINEGLVNGFEHVNILNNGHLLMANQNGFWDVDFSAAHGGDSAPKPLISYVYANGDSLVFRATGGDTTLSLPFSLNSLRFEFASPDFRTGDGSRYSSYLEGYDKTWSPLSTESTREYTRLSEGKYTLHLRALNLQTGQEAETEFRFEITPPWYRSLIAKIVYLILVTGAFITGVYLIKRWKSNAERRMERQKDYEIAALKSKQLEVDIKHKSDELSSATMNLIRKNEILQDIATKIAHIQSEQQMGAGVQKQLSHIQTSIEQNISHDDDWSTFNRNFDVVYSGYTKRLHELHPQLSQSDVRLCCYIKMGLTSKEIAPLVNISYKSVEMARYRLRKKIALDPAVSLTDYIASL